MKHLFTKPIAVFVLLFLLLDLSASAQPITGDEIKTQFIKDWERAKAYTLDYLNAMPADKYSFKPVDSIRSFAQQMLHLASVNVFFVTTATGDKIDWPGTDPENSPTAQNKDSVVYYVTKSYDFAIKSVKNLDLGKLGEITGFGKYKFTRYACLLKGFEHQTHHRGQTTIYLRLLGIKPPGERLF